MWGKKKVQPEVTDGPPVLANSTTISWRSVTFVDHATSQSYVTQTGNNWSALGTPRVGDLIAFSDYGYENLYEVVVVVWDCRKTSQRLLIRVRETTSKADGSISDAVSSKA